MDSTRHFVTEKVIELFDQLSDIHRITVRKQCTWIINYHYLELPPPHPTLFPPLQSADTSYRQLSSVLSASDITETTRLLNVSLTLGQR